MKIIIPADFVRRDYSVDKVPLMGDFFILIIIFSGILELEQAVIALRECFPSFFAAKVCLTLKLAVAPEARLFDLMNLQPGAVFFLQGAVWLVDWNQGYYVVCSDKHDAHPFPHHVTRPKTSPSAKYIVSKAAKV